MIPTTAHFIWLGPMAPWVSPLVAGFAALHPGWGISLWRDLPRGMPPGLRKAANACDQWCSVSDILSYWLLHEYGGFYLDADTITLRSFEPLRSQAAFAYRQQDKRVNCSAMGAEPGHPAFAEILTGVRRAAGRVSPGSVPGRTAYGPSLLTEIAKTSDLLTLLPTHYFAPFEHAEAHQFWHADAEQREAMLRAAKRSDGEAPFAVHLWGLDGSSHAGRKP